MNAVETQSLVTLIVAVLVVYRFARRELKERTIAMKALWLRPLIMVALAAYLITLTALVDPAGIAEMLVTSAAGAGLGLITGFAIVRFTSFRPAPIPNAVRVMGSTITFAIWILALALRFVARFVVPHGTEARTQLPLNCGTVTMAAVAFVVIAIAFAVEIKRYAGISGSDAGVAG